MLKNQAACIIEFASNAFCVTSISPDAKIIRHQVIPYAPDVGPKAAEDLRAFMGSAPRRCRVIALLPDVTVSKGGRYSQGFLTWPVDHIILGQSSWGAT